MSTHPPFDDRLDDQPTQDASSPSWPIAAVAEAPAVISDRYELLRELGRGGTGIVYKARDRETGVLVALKVLKAEIAANPAALERFKNELRLARQITHPNVCRIYEFQRVGDTAFITMEAVEGESLRHVLRRRGKLQSAEAVRILIAVCEGLQAAHQRGIIHRDLKPENVMVEPGGHIKVMDFGLAHLVREDTAHHEKIAGTPRYMAPEQAKGGRPVLATDIYACGLILYEMLTGDAAFPGESGVQMMLRQIQEKVVPPRSLEPTVSISLNQVVLKCLEKDPALRFGSLGELRAALESEIAQPAPASGLASKSRRTFAWIAVAAAILVGVLLLSPWRKSLLTLAAPGQTLVVLPCEENAGGADDRANCDGLIDTLASSIARDTLGRDAAARSARVPAVIPSREIRDRKVRTVQSAKQDLGATVVLTASWQRSGEQIRVNLGLVDPASSRQVRSETITADAGDLFALQDQVVSRAESMLGLHVAIAAPAATARQAARTNSSAYDAYWRGRGYFQEYDKPENLDRAITQFQDAIRQDDKFARAWASLGEAFDQKAITTHTAEWRDQAKTACQTATSLDAELPEGHVCLGRIFNATGEYQQAADQFKLALAKSPANDLAYRGLGFAYSNLQLPAEAAANYRKAIAGRPDYWAGYSWMGAFLYSQGCYAQAADMFTDVTRLSPTNFWGYSNLGGALQQQGRYEEARQAFEKSLTIRPNEGAYNNFGVFNLAMRRYAAAEAAFEQSLRFDPTRYVAWGNLGNARYLIDGRRAAAEEAYRKAIALGLEELKANPKNFGLLKNLARYYSRIGDKNAAMSKLQAALALAPKNPGVLGEAALVAVQLGDREAAIDYLGKAMAAGESPASLRDTPDFDGLRGDPRFQALLQKYPPRRAPEFCGKL